MNNELVTVIIPTYNRFNFIKNSIKSVIEQTYQNIEIIVVNDCSTQPEYYTFDWKKKFGDKFYILHLPRNSKDIFGFPSPGGHARNMGMMIAKGEYIAFLDDDDYFLPTKIETQIKMMKQYNCKLSCTESVVGNGIYDKNKQYSNYCYKGMLWRKIIRTIKKIGGWTLICKMYENDVNVWDKICLQANFTAGGSTMIIKKELIKQAGYFPIMSYMDDWEYWKELIKHSNMVYIKTPLAYIDLGHGSGINYNRSEIIIN